jgi:hypothetical protein
LEVRFRARSGPDRLVQYFPPERPRTDHEGRFRIEGLLAGYQFRLFDDKDCDLSFGDGLDSGQTKDLGDVRMKGQEP